MLSVVAAIFYIPLGFYTEQFFYRRRQAKQLEQQGKR